jgi:hypothetical protein
MFIFPILDMPRVGEVTIAPVEVGAPAGETQAPLLVPLRRDLDWTEVHRLTQTPHRADDPVLATLRASAGIRRGTRMVKVLSPAHAAGYLRGWLPHGFCYRDQDVAHLRTPDDLALLRTDGVFSSDVAYALRWRAVDPADYTMPVGTEHSGLVAMPAHDRMGSPVLGTGFTPSGRHVIPEFLTTDIADLPMPAGTTLVAHPPSGEEVILYRYQAEQRGWLRMAGPAWRHLLAMLPDVRPDQEYVQMPDLPRSSRLVGAYRGEECEALADPPHDFRVLAMTRAARYPVETLKRRTAHGRWRDADCLVLRQEGRWLRLRLRRPDPDNVARLAAQCHDRGVYETWAPLGEVTERALVDSVYAL